MASTVEEIEESIRQAISTGFRGRLLERGLARSMIWIDAELPAGSPNFSDRLSYDLKSYGYSLLSLAIRLSELKGDANLCKAAFEKSATAIIDVIHNGNPDDPENGFHRVMAASSFHLGRYSAKAFSLIHNGIETGTLRRMEKMLSLLMLRQFDKLENSIAEWKASGIATDEALATQLEEKIDQFNVEVIADAEPEEHGITSIEIPIIDLAITDNYYSTIFEFLFALETGQARLLEGAIHRIENCLSICSELNMVPQWWVLRITKYLLTDLWESSFHAVLPTTSGDEHGESWAYYRRLFIATLFKRSKSEVDLWPSQLEGARRAVNDLDDLVVSLPTSAGKTRIAELCILRCLAIGKRVLFITPLRALSAQTEASLRKTFLPLGKSVSSLYGSMGTSDFEQDVLKAQDIVVGTPEKLDFALRNDPTLIDDVGLVVLDEGHMIGLNEREINYEVQIQRLLKREDADQRRIVCLSAILPDGDQLEDFVGWLRRDKEGDAIQSDWRPTDLRFGEIVWRGNSGQLKFTIGEERPFINNFIIPFVPSLPNPGVRRTPFPNNGQELSLATAWRLLEDDHTVLIYCPQKSSVNGFAKIIIDLHKRGALTSVLEVSQNELELAKALGDEWLGNGHPIVKCLDLGVAVHHGGLPTPFRKEMEKLLRAGVLKVTISSPTLAQGLNLSATAVIIHSLHRNGEIVDSSEFKNVIGRAGRAFIDTHGLVLHPMFNNHTKRKNNWRELVENTNARNMESGLLRLVFSLLNRMAKSLGTKSPNDVLEYILGNAQVWNFPAITDEEAEKTEEERTEWNKYMISLDTALLSMLGAEDIPVDQIPDALDTILQSSLWERRIARLDGAFKDLLNKTLSQRGKHIWNVTTARQRKGYYLAGMGLVSGQLLDTVSQQANILLVNSNAYIAADENELAIGSITELAELLFEISPFIPSMLPDDWREILVAWLKGEKLTECTFINLDDALKFIEDGLVYRLPWALEAIRVRAQANEDEIEGIRIEEYELGLVVPAIENGTLNRSAALLMQAGFSSRNSAIYAVSSTNAVFTNSHQFKDWLHSDLVQEYTRSLVWPTPETSKLWLTFLEEYQPSSETTWESVSDQVPVEWLAGQNPDAGMVVKILNGEIGNTQVIASDCEQIGHLDCRYNLLKSGIYYATVNEDISYLDVTFFGAEKSPFEIERVSPVIE